MNTGNSPMVPSPPPAPTSPRPPARRWSELPPQQTPGCHRQEWHRNLRPHGHFWPPTAGSPRYDCHQLVSPTVDYHQAPPIPRRPRQHRPLPPVPLPAPSPGPSTTGPVQTAPSTFGVRHQRAGSLPPTSAVVTTYSSFCTTNTSTTTVPPTTRATTNDNTASAGAGDFRTRKGRCETLRRAPATSTGQNFDHQSHQTPATPGFTQARCPLRPDKPRYKKLHNRLSLQRHWAMQPLTASPGTADADQAGRTRITRSWRPCACPFRDPC